MGLVGSRQSQPQGRAWNFETSNPNLSHILPPTRKHCLGNTNKHIHLNNKGVAVTGLFTYEYSEIWLLVCFIRMAGMIPAGILASFSIVAHGLQENETWTIPNPKV